MNLDQRIDSLVNTLTALKKESELLELVQKEILSTFARGGKLVIAGNGGSAADASHIAGEFVGRYQKKRRPLPAINISADIATLTCIANDYDFTEVFSRQVQALCTEHDIFIAISTSGNSSNILHAVDLATAKGAKVIALTGENGHSLIEKSDIALKVRSKVTSEIQSAYMCFMHLICEMIDENI
ncbi:SIS domain-containing protein [Amylibacter sp.]|nr:SIS domain-containing protein [Amylibacter sp.]